MGFSMSNVTNANEKSVSSINGVIKCGSTPLGLKMKYGQETFREGYTEDKKKKSNLLCHKDGQTQFHI